MDYLQVALTAGREEADQISDALEDLGALSITIQSANSEDAYDAALPGEPQWREQRVVALFPAARSKRDLLDALLPWKAACDLEFSTLEDRDWERAWLEQFQPIRINDKLWVVPSWHEAPERSALNLVIDPGLAFGTGTHPTTRICLEHLSRLDLSGKRVVDYGCGSGILAIAAAALGSREVIATDLDPRALDATRKNAEINGYGEVVACMTPDQVDNDLGEAADVVVANILASTIKAIRARILNLLDPGGLLILSGILPDQADDIVRYYPSIPDFRRYEEAGWMLLSGIAGPAVDAGRKRGAVS